MLCNGTILLIQHFFIPADNSGYQLQLQQHDKFEVYFL